MRPPRASVQGEADIVTGTALLPTQASGHCVLRAEASPNGARSRPEVSGQVEEASAHVKRGSEPRGHRHPPLPPVLSPPRHLSNTPPCAGKPSTPPPWGGSVGPPPLRPSRLAPACFRSATSAPGASAWAVPRRGVPPLGVGPHPTHPLRPSQSRRGRGHAVAPSRCPNREA